MKIPFREVGPDNYDRSSRSRSSRSNSAPLALIGLISGHPECGEVYIGFVPDNEGAERLYRNIGFLPTGETDETCEIIMRYAVMSKQASNIG